MNKDAAIFRVIPVEEEDMTKPRRRLAAVVAALTIGVTLGSTSAWAQKPPPGPKGEPMRGTWGFSVSGTIVASDGTPPTPVAIVGLITFDPLTRDCVVEDRINAGGTSLRRTGATCTYSLLPDGRGSFVVLFDGETEFTFHEFVLVNRKREMRLIRTDLAVMEGAGRRQ
jgi:hypothetical protein